METGTITIPVEPKVLQDIITESIRKRIKLYPHNSIWASQVDHPCIRYNEYGLTRWQDQMLISPDLQEIFDEGNIHEPAIEEKLRNAGFKIRQSQRPLFETVEKLGKRFRYAISGRLDLEITHDALNNLWYPAEMKTMEPFAWESINTVDDMKNHKRPYLRMYPSQLMIYLYMMNVERGLMILKNKVNGKLKFIWVEIDLEIVERMLQKAEKINADVEQIEKNSADAEQILHQRIDYDEKICGKCPFAHICLPDSFSTGVEIDLDEETEIKLRRREELKSIVSEFDKLDEELKESFKARGIGKYLVGGSFNVDVTECLRKGYVVKDTKVTTVKIKKLQQPKELTA
jgi:CRISPR/Cas system-associated exonuclease Cas4 (RecB family)